MKESDSEALHDGVYLALHQRIIKGELKPGSRVVESRLAEELKVSRTPLREALFRLEQDGLVRSEVNKGFLVQGLSAREAREVYPILWTLECQALESSGILATSLCESLTQINRKMGKSKGSSTKAQALDTLWHQTLLSRCPNRLLLQFIEKLRSMAQRYEFVFMQDTSLVGKSVEQHNRIIASLKQRDLESAQQTLMENWQDGLELLLLVIGEA